MTASKQAQVAEQEVIQFDKHIMFVKTLVNWAVIFLHDLFYVDNILIETSLNKWTPPKQDINSQVS